jgi:ketosteroid isomerase-like protein
VLLSEIPAIPVDHPLRPILDQRYLDLRAAMASGDAGNVLAVLAPDFVSEDIDGKRQTGQQMAEAVTRLQIDRSKRTALTVITEIVISGDGDLADVEQRYQMTTTEQRENLPRKLLTKSRDRWINIAGQWRVASTTTLAIEMVTNEKHALRARLDPSNSDMVVELRKGIPAGGHAETA